MVPSRKHCGHAEGAAESAATSVSKGGAVPSQEAGQHLTQGAGAVQGQLSPRKKATGICRCLVLGTGTVMRVFHIPVTVLVMQERKKRFVYG